MWLPDTNVWIALLNARPSPVKARLQAVRPEQIFLCDIVKAELYFGAFNSARRDDNLRLLEELFASFVSLPFDSQASREFGQIRAELARLGTPIGPYDLQIAAVARARGLVLVTHNTGEFSRVPDLQIEDWEL
jgi:tRNA(fMet)-specific endonuclease VapC